MEYEEILNKNILKIIEVLSKENMYFNQIHELTKIKSRNNLLRNLKKLTELKILDKKKNKSNTTYNINYENSYAQILLQQLNVIKLEFLPYARKQTIKEIINETLPVIGIIFGSTAKGTFNKNSDIDLLLIYDNKIKNNSEIIKKISLKYGTKINSLSITLKEFESKDDSIKHILKTGYPVSGYNYFYRRIKNV
jgi:predicted nucleotidyltransferase